MSTSKTIPVRFSAETARRLAEADERLKLGNKSLLVKLCLEAFLRAFEAEGAVVLPLKWREIAWSLDGRRSTGLGLAAETGEPVSTPVRKTSIQYPTAKKPKAKR